MFFAVVLFLVVLAVIASERLHRTKVALLGATLVVLTQTLDQEGAIEAIDFNTIGLLAGMMILVYLTQQTGVYDVARDPRRAVVPRTAAARSCSALASRRPLLSAFLDNLTTVLLVVPITFLLADALDVDPIPLIVVEVMASNIGGTATLIGDPPNILIAGVTRDSVLQRVHRQPRAGRDRHLAS